MKINAFDVAERFIGVTEIPGSQDNSQILAMLKLDHEWPEHDEVPWCSGYLNYVCWLLRLPRSKSLLARSWLNVGWHVPLVAAERGFDVVVLTRGAGQQPGAWDTSAPGHVGLYAGIDKDEVYLLGGNQGDAVSVAGFRRSRVLGVRRLWEPK